MPLHLEEHLDSARVEGSELPEHLPDPVEWRFAEPQPDWKPAPIPKPVKIEVVKDAVRISLTEGHRRNGGAGRLLGGLYVPVPDWQRDEWAYVLVEGRTSDPLGRLGLGFGLRETDPDEDNPTPFLAPGERTDLVTDGFVHTYRLGVDFDWGKRDATWRDLGLWFTAEEPGSLELLSVTVVPREARFSDAPVGVRNEFRGTLMRRALYLHTPGRLVYRLQVPENGQLSFGLGVLRQKTPVTFLVKAASIDDDSGAQTLLQLEYSETRQWAQRTVDLSDFEGREVMLSLEVAAKVPGTVALWAAPTVSGIRATTGPNVILYVIDSGDANQMSVYGYNRRTTPFLERLAEESVVFENAYSNSRWTKVSTASFMTSLHNSVLGGYRTDADPLPDQAKTITERLHEAGYQTGVFVTNPFAGTLSGLDRGADVLRDAGANLDSISSAELHEQFWEWRADYPGKPYFAHFQTTDVHEPFYPPPPFSGLWVSPQDREQFDEWDRQLSEVGSHYPWSPAFQKAGISRQAFFNIQRGLYDECMAHNDYQLGELVKGLRASGEWENTVLIVSSDHGMWGASDMVDLGLLENLPEEYGPMFRPSLTKIPLIVTAPGRIAGGRRLSQPVSMIDVVPTILELVGLSPPEISQGQSLAPLLRGETDGKLGPVILDEFQTDLSTGEQNGWIEVIDGRWGASLQVGADDVRSARPEMYKWRGRPAPLLLYDLWVDRYCLRSVHSERPDLVKKYTRFLEQRLEEHRSLAERFTRSSDSILTPEQLSTLRSLGYIQ
jgi:arylsulfatase A-like enzyme